MSDLERAEESRERNEPLAYDDYHERLSEPAEQVDAYEPDDPKSDGYYERMVDLSDVAEQGA